MIRQVDVRPLAGAHSSVSPNASSITPLLASRFTYIRRLRIASLDSIVTVTCTSLALRRKHNFSPRPFGAKTQIAVPFLTGLNPDRKPPFSAARRVSSNQNEWGY